MRTPKTALAVLALVGLLACPSPSPPPAPRASIVPVELTPAPTPATTPAPPPEIHDWLLPFPDARLRLTAAYLSEHSGRAPTGDLAGDATMTPRAVVLHWTGGSTAQGAWSTFAPTTLGGRPELEGAGALNVSAHFLVDRDGTIHRLMPDDRVGRHVIGLNHVAVGIENVGGGDLILTAAQEEANAALVRYLAGRWPVTHLFGHHRYRELEGTDLFVEADPTYRTSKVDPGDDFVCAVASRVSDLGLEVVGKEHCAPSTTLWFGGDVHLGDGSEQGPALAPVRDLVGGAPGVVNLEGPVGQYPSGEVDGTTRLFNDPAQLAQLAAAGVQVAGIANNHSEDAGADGVAETTAALAEGQVRAVAGPSHAVLGAPGPTVAVTAHHVGDGPPAGLADDLAHAERAADFLVSTLHVEGPSSYLPPPALEEAVEIALAAGADLVVAHGTHVVGRVERRGEAVILWGLGNLVFDCTCSAHDEGLLAVTTFTEGRPVSVRVVPVRAGLHGAPVQPHPRPDELLDLLESLRSSPLRRDGGAARVE